MNKRVTKRVMAATLITATTAATIGLSASSASAEADHAVFGARTETSLSSTYGLGGGALIDGNTLTYTSYPQGTITQRDLTTGEETPFASLPGAFDLDRDSQGDIWATSIGYYYQSQNAGLVEYGPDGTVKQTIGDENDSYDYNWSVAVDQNDNVWYTDESRNTVNEVGQDGTKITSWSAPENTDVYGIDTYGDEIYVLEDTYDNDDDSDTSSIAVYDTEGNLQRSIPIADGQNTWTYGIAIGTDGVIYASTEYYNNDDYSDSTAINAYSQAGSLLDSIDTGLTSQEDYNYNLSVSADELYYTTTSGQFEQIALQNPVFTTTSLANGTVGTTYSASIVATAKAKLTYSVTKGSLPAGLTLAADGTISGTPTTAGDSTFTVKADAGLATSATFTIHVAAAAAAPAAPVTALPAAKLKVTLADTAIIGRHTTVKASGLAAGEKYTLRIAGRVVATGAASATGTVKKSVVVPTTAGAGERRAAVVGSVANRKGSAEVTLYKVSSPKLSLAEHTASASTNDTLTVAKLIPGEKVVVTYNDKRISSSKAVASSAGRYKLTFDVGTKWGNRTLKVKAVTSDRSTSTLLAVNPFIG